LFIYDERRMQISEHAHSKGWADTSKLPVDVLLIRQNPRKTLAEIMERFPCRTIVLDGSNYPGTIARLEDEIGRHNMEYYLLKDNFAYVWVLEDDDDYY